MVKPLSTCRFLIGASETPPPYLGDASGLTHKMWATCGRPPRGPPGFKHKWLKYKVMMKMSFAARVSPPAQKSPSDAAIAVSPKAKKSRAAISRRRAMGRTRVSAVPANTASPSASIMPAVVPAVTATVE